MWLQQHWAFWNVGLNIERHCITKIYKNNLKMMLSTQNASLGIANHDNYRSFIWKHLWKARWQQCNSFVSFNHLANHQNHEWTKRGVSKQIYIRILSSGCQVFINLRRGPNWIHSCILIELVMLPHMLDVWV